MNDALRPLSCSARGTTSLRVSVKYGAALGHAPIVRVKKGATVTIRGTLLTGDDSSAPLTPRKKTGDSWTRAVVREVVTQAGATRSLTFRRTLATRTTYRLAYAGDGDTWDATSRTRTVRPL